MKNKINYLVLLFVMITSCKAQSVVNINTYNDGDNSNKYFKDIDNNCTNFIGTWENTNGNTTFRLILWKEPMRQLRNEQNSFRDDIYGSYLIIENANTPTEHVVYNSIKYFPQNGYTSNSVIVAYASNQNEFGGYFTDTNANNGTFVLDGAFSLKIINPGVTPSQGHWKLKGFINNEPNNSFVVPTDIILTKIN